LHGTCSLTFVDETNYSLAPLAHPEGRSRNLAVVTNKLGLTQVGVDLDIDRFDLNLIIVEERAIGIWNGAIRV
jgi:hypothetical protein